MLPFLYEQLNQRGINMTTMEVKEFIKKLKEKNDIWDE